MTVVQGEGRRESYSRAGFIVPSREFILDPLRFWQLTGEGWKFVVGEDGSIVAYLPPVIEDRLAALAVENAIAREFRRKKKP